MSKNVFQSLKNPKVGRSKFDLSHEKKLSLQMGDLVPVLCQEIVPGDSFRVNTDIFLRLQALLSPVMHKVNVTTHYFFVPNRLIWTEFQDFITRGRTGSVQPIHPFINIGDAQKSYTAVGTLADYFGLPDISGVAVTRNLQISALPFRAYQLIYDEYYRDNTLTAPVDVSKLSGDSTGTIATHMSMRKRAWEKDYFTTSRPSSQLGPDVSIPSDNTVNYLNQSLVKTVAGVNANANSLVGVDSAGTPGMAINKTANNVNGTAGRIENIASITSTMLINNLRRALALQKFYEKNMRAGSRYVEQILSHFGVRSSDARLQRPEYLGGGKQDITISEVLQTAEGTNPVGTMNGHGYSVGSSNRFAKTFEEHGFVIAIMSVLPKTAYQQGVERMWTRTDSFDYYWPEFANIGEQEVRAKEIYFDPVAPTPTQNDSTWGYQQRYAEYKYQPSTVHGEFKGSLNFWHMGRIFTSLPPLSTNFVQADPTQRIFAVTDPNIDKCLVQIHHNIDAIRPMPYYSVPAI